MPKTGHLQTIEYLGLGYKCADNYSNKESLDQVIEKIKCCSSFYLTV